MSAPVDLSRIFDGHYPGNGLAVVDAADDLHAKLSDAQFVASFAPPIVSYRSCVCGCVMEVRSHDGAISDDDRDALRDWDDVHMGCEVAS